jgi:galactokinase
MSSDELVAALVAWFPEAAERLGEIRIVRSPGRVNLIGEHTDYNLGFVLPAAIDLEIRMALVPVDDGRVELRRLGSNEQATFQVDVQRPARGRWIDYAEGTAWALAEAGYRTTGFRGVVASTLPAGGGLSSSAAIELGTAWALLGDAASSVDQLDLARICQRGENGYVGVRSGLMDQFAVACGIAGAALLLDCRSFEWRPVGLPPDVRVVVIDSRVPRKLAGSAYNERREQCDAAVAAFQAVDPSIESLRDVDRPFLDEHVELLDEVVARRVRHVVDENQRVLDVIAAFEAGDLAAVGAAFAASHASLRDLYEVSSPELDALVEIATSVDGVIAARMTGAGFGGCTVNLVQPDAVDRLRTAIARDYPTRTGRTATVMPVAIADGAGWLAR